MISVLSSGNTTDKQIIIFMNLNSMTELNIHRNAIALLPNYEFERVFAADCIHKHEIATEYGWQAKKFWQKEKSIQTHISVGVAFFHAQPKQRLTKIN